MFEDNAGPPLKFSYTAACVPGDFFHNRQCTGNNRSKFQVVGSMNRWIQLLDGSYLQDSHITRLSVTGDITRGTFDIMASVGGPQFPYLLSKHASKQDAQDSLDNMVSLLGDKYTAHLDEEVS